MPVDDEAWKQDDDQVKYVPLQAKEGDLAIFLLSGATEVMYEKGKIFYRTAKCYTDVGKREEDL